MSLIFGITDRGKRLNPIYAREQPDLFQYFLKILFSLATSVARLSESYTAIGSFTCEINFPLFTITNPP